MTKSRSPSTLWTKQHGYGTPNAVRRKATMPKIAYANEWSARDRALLDDLRHGVAMEAYPCLWGNDYHDGRTAPLHWHVGRTRERRIGKNDR